MKIEITEEQRDWLLALAKSHNLITVEEALQKLIEIYKAWNDLLGDVNKLWDEAQHHD